MLHTLIKKGIVGGLYDSRLALSRALITVNRTE